MTTEKFGRYEIKQRLGQGGMATVYLAHDPRFGRDVALKVLPRQFLHDPQFRERFEREARTIARLEHKAIVPVYDFGEHDDQPYLVMRYMMGGSLEDQIKQKGPLSLEETVRIVGRIASALDEAHQHGIVHRDLKPGNILFDQQGDPYLSDFGIVKLSEATANLTGNAIVGTPAYMSPEQVHGRSDIDGRSDIYTLGVILFELLIGRIPYPADTPTQMMMAHVLEPVPTILLLKQDLPPLCESVVQRAMSKDTKDRYKTAGEMAEALKNATSSRGYTPLETPDQTTMATKLDWQQTTPMPSPIEAKQEEPQPTEGSIDLPDWADIPLGNADTPSGGAAGESTLTKGKKFALWGCGAPLIGLLSLIGLCVIGLFAFVIYYGDQFTGTPTAESIVESLDDSTPASSLSSAISGLGTQNETPTAEALPTDTPEPTMTPTIPPTSTAEPTETPASEEPSDQEPLYTADFNRIGSWPSGEIMTTNDAEEEVVGALIDVRNGVYDFETLEPATLFWVTSGEAFEDAIYELEATAVEGALDNGFGMLFMVESDTDSFYMFEISSDGFVWLGRCTEACAETERFVEDGWFASEAVNQGLNTTNTLRVIVEDGTLIFFVNDQEVATIEDSVLTEGDIGLFVETFDEGEVRIEFDNFTITPLPTSEETAETLIDDKPAFYQLTADATDVISMSSDLGPQLIYQTEESVADVVAFYRALAEEQGLEERTADTLLIEDSTAYLVFDDAANERAYILAVTSLEENQSVILTPES